MIRQLLIAGLTAGLMFCPLAGGPTPARAEAAPGGMFELYEANQKAGTPNYITEDFLLLSHAMVVNSTVTKLEAGVLRPSLAALVTGLHDKLAPTAEKDPVDAGCLDFLAVLSSLLSGEKAPAEGMAANPEAVAGELSRIYGAEGIAQSPLMGQIIDYSQLQVRGKYTANESLGQYFRAMRYAGTVLFPVLESKATKISAETADALTRQALRMVRLMEEDEGLRRLREEIETRLTYLFGPPDDLTGEDYLAVAQAHPEAPISDIRKALLKRAKETGRRPAILSGVVTVADLEPDRRAADVLTGWRFIPGRFSPDAAAFQKLVFESVEDYQGEGDPFTAAQIEGRRVKGFPMGLELLALLGVEPAVTQLKDAGETNYKGYPEAAAEARDILNRSLSAPGLIPDMLDTIDAWLREGNAPEGADRIGGALAYWTWGRYVTLLYAKQSYTQSGKSGDLIPEDRPGAWLDPSPGLYLHLADGVRRLRDQLEGTAADATALAAVRKNLRGIADAYDRCRRIAAAARRGDAPTGDDAAFLNELDGTLARLIGETDQPIVVDVHTEPNSGRVLEEAVGHPRPVTRKVGDHTARGARFTYYEFKYPMAERLTNDQWRLILTDPGELEKLTHSPASDGAPE